MFAAGASANAIAKKLDGEAITGPGGRPWGDTAIRGAQHLPSGLVRGGCCGSRFQPMGRGYRLYPVFKRASQRGPVPVAFPSAVAFWNHMFRMLFSSN